MEYEKGFIDPKRLTQDEVEELVGEMATHAGEWVPLCPTYPGLKGIECGPVTTFNDHVKKMFDECSPIKLSWARRMHTLVEMPLNELKDYLVKNSVELEKWDSYRRSDGERPSWIPEDVDYSKLSSIDSFIYQVQSWYSELAPTHGGPSWQEYLKGYLAASLDPEMLLIKQTAFDFNRESDPDWTCKIGFDASGGDPRISHQARSFDEEQDGFADAYLDTTQRDYWNSVKVYSRDELFDLARKMGRDMAEGVDLDLETYRKYLQNHERDWSTNWNEASYDVLAPKASKDRKWQNYKTNMGNYRHDRAKIADDMGIDDVIGDEHTIFVTTPRGGLEFLGIFAYAHNIPKSQIPARYEEAYSEDDKKNPYYLKTAEQDLERMVGRTWLNNRSQPIRRVVIVDDTVESGEQQLKAHGAVRSFFGDDVEIIHAAACGRRRPNPYYYNEAFLNLEHEPPSMYDKEPDKGQKYARPGPEESNIYDEAIYGQEMYDFEQWRMRQDEIGFERNSVCACAFPWSISDSQSSNYLRLVYGTRFERGKRRVSGRSERP